MNVEKSYITDSIILLTFENQYDITSTLLRFQEFYESPKFQGTLFTLAEFKDWYTKEKGSFSYYSDWNGFNFPSTVLTKFNEGLFNPLSESEEKILSLLQEEKGCFYVIGIHKQGKPDTLIHEIGHALFFTNVEYRNQVLIQIDKYDLSQLTLWLKESGGYADSVINDELHAYSLASDKDESMVPVEIKKKLTRIYTDFT